MKYTLFGVSFLVMWAAYIVGTMYPDMRGCTDPLTILAIVLFKGLAAILSVPRANEGEYTHASIASQTWLCRPGRDGRVRSLEGVHLQRPFAGLRAVRAYPFNRRCIDGRVSAFARAQEVTP